MSGLEHFIIANPAWAYLILFGGMFIEGEAFFLTAAVFALQGHLSWLLILLVTFAGVVLGDITWYGLGRYLRQTKLGFLLRIKLSAYQEWLEQNFISRYQRMAFYSKFLYYINRLTPLIAGWQKFSPGKFIKIHLGAAIVWIGLMAFFSSALGYAVGDAAIRWLLGRIEFVFFGSALIFIIGEYALKKAFSKKISRSLPERKS